LTAEMPSSTPNAPSNLITAQRSSKSSCCCCYLQCTEERQCRRTTFVNCEVRQCRRTDLVVVCLPIQGPFWGGGARRLDCSQQEWHCLPGQEPASRLSMYRHHVSSKCTYSHPLPTVHHHAIVQQCPTRIFPKLGLITPTHHPPCRLTCTRSTRYHCVMVS
jgi:hypothetical protein